MKNFSTSALSSSIIVATLLVSPIAKGGEYTYNPSADIAGKFSKARNIAEFNYMQPLLDSGNLLPIIDLKLKADNNKSKEINLGFVLRSNYEDKAIFGTYAYFDRRRTASRFTVSALTAGVEVLSKYIDARANIYVPENKKKKLAHRNVAVQIEGTSIFALHGGHRYESALRGYDIEVGTPVFGISDELNEKLGTKVHVARYSFKGKYTKLIIGTRFRLEQPIATMWAGNNSYNMYMNAETQYDTVRKRQNFVGFGVKVIFGDKANVGKKNINKLDHRMMETIIRDVDQVVMPYDEDPIKSNFVINGKKTDGSLHYAAADSSDTSGTIIDKILHVASFNNADHKGDGTEANPLSFKQLKDEKTDNAIIVLTQVGDKEITPSEALQLSMDHENVVGHGEDMNLTAAGEAFVIGDKDGVSISTQDGVTTNLLGKDKHEAVKPKIAKLTKIATKMQSIVRMKPARVEFDKRKLEALFDGDPEQLQIAENTAFKLQYLFRRSQAQKERAGQPLFDDKRGKGFFSSAAASLSHGFQEKLDRVMGRGKEVSEQAAAEKQQQQKAAGAAYKQALEEYEATGSKEALNRLETDNKAAAAEKKAEAYRLAAEKKAAKAQEVADRKAAAVEAKRAAAAEKAEKQAAAAEAKKAAADQLAAEKAEKQAVAAEAKKAAVAEKKAAADQLAAEKAEKKAAADQLAAEKKAAADQLAAEKKAAADRLVAEKKAVAAEKKAATTEKKAAAKDAKKAKELDLTPDELEVVRKTAISLQSAFRQKKAIEVAAVKRRDADVAISNLGLEELSAKTEVLQMQVNEAQGEYNRVRGIRDTEKGRGVPKLHRTKGTGLTEVTRLSNVLRDKKASLALAAKEKQKVEAQALKHEAEVKAAEEAVKS